MRMLRLSLLVIFSMSSFFLSDAVSQNSKSLPHLEKHGTTTQLIVDGKPFLMFAGELGNSSSSSAQYMKPIWPKLAKMHLNTVLVPVYWELIEPTEGHFDFSLVDDAINSARANNLKIVYLWFGTWKNSMSCYAPYWVKTNEKRFPRARMTDGRPVEIVTPFSSECRDADAKAFAALMKHTRAIDGGKQTVVMVQVENEIGMIPEARDHGDLANKAFSEQVPPELMAYMEKNKESFAPEAHQPQAETPELLKLWQDAGFKTSGTWDEVFAKTLQTDEVFMAWYYARYTNYVAEAGKKEYPLPMYVNAALVRPGWKPGQYPSAGPLPHLFDVWKLAAPEIDFLSPDIYFPTFLEWSTKYARPDNPLFIPEVSNRQSMTNAFYAFAQEDAMGYSPFSIESIPDPGNSPVAEAYDVLNQLKPLILKDQGTDKIAGFLIDSLSQKPHIKLGDYFFNVRHGYTWPFAVRTELDTPRVGGMIIMLSPDEFLIAGSGFVVTFQSADDGTVAGIASMNEGEFVNGKWVEGRRMNGDQDNQGRQMDLSGPSFQIQKVKLYRYK
jgi:hypothetical protein